MMLDAILDAGAAVLVVVGALLSLTAAIGVVRFPDTLTRIHASAKPQVFGLACILAAAVLGTRSWQLIAVAVLLLLFQMVTTPAAAHMVGRAAYRQAAAESRAGGLLFVDELETAVEAASVASEDEDEDEDDGDDRTGGGPGGGPR